VIASIRGERDIAVGNAIGSNLFNLLGVLGITSLIAPAGLSVAPAAVNFDIPFMIAVAIACLPIFVHGHALLRFEGLIFLLYYIAYTVYLILKASEHDALPEFSMVMRFFVIPLTLLTLVIITLRVIRQARRQQGEA
jgi:cation:H+ antiporter